ncbi:MAG: hypothetical protein QW329_01310 [Archaeoglobaceae archaeon]
MSFFVIVNFLSVNTAWNREKVVELMKNRGFEVVFLDLPEHFEPYFANKIVPAPELGFSQDLKSCEPIINHCWENGIRICCYLDNRTSQERRDIQIELAKLVLRSKLKGIDVEEWKEVVFKDIAIRESSAEFVEMKIRDNAGELNACLNLPPEVESALEKDFVVKKVAVYDFRRPIDKIYELAFREMSGENISDEQWLELIRKHIAFVDTVVEVGYEEACKFIWI